MKTKAMAVCVMAGILAICGAARAVDIQTVPVGNVRNNGDDSTGYGEVDYLYNIGKHEVTAGQYTEFLNAVAQTDTNALYHPDMVGNPFGCQITQSGPSGNYVYTIAPDSANRPVNYVSFWDACRFANWLHNGQGASDTETGAYTLTADAIAANTVTRNPTWRWAVTSEDEWYKAAYHKNNGDTGDYFGYPTSSDDMPSNDLVNPDPGNNATFNDGDYTIGAPFYRTQGGAHENSASPYGTFDQAGNVFEWNETIEGLERGIRGGSFNESGAMHASYRASSYYAPEGGHFILGFRVSEVPEPATLSLLALGGLVALRRRRR